VVCAVRRTTGRLAAALLATVLLAGCGGSSDAAEEFTGTPVDPPFEVAGTTLATTTGEEMSLADPGKRLTLVFFGYTSCPDVCPLVMSSIAGAVNRLDEEDRSQVQVAFVTTDPKVDSPPVMQEYLDDYGIQQAGATAVGGRAGLDETVELARSMGIFVADAKQLRSGGFDLGSHGSQVIAVDASGRAPAFWNQDVSPAQLSADIETLLSES
jgi:protein SCO1